MMKPAKLLGIAVVLISFGLANAGGSFLTPEQSKEVQEVTSQAKKHQSDRGGCFALGKNLEQMDCSYIDDLGKVFPKSNFDQMTTDEFRAFAIGWADNKIHSEGNGAGKTSVDETYIFRLVSWGVKLGNETLRTVLHKTVLSRLDLFEQMGSYPRPWLERKDRRLTEEDEKREHSIHELQRAFWSQEYNLSEAINWLGIDLEREKDKSAALNEAQFLIQIASRIHEDDCKNWLMRESLVTVELHGALDNLSNHPDPKIKDLVSKNQIVVDDYISRRYPRCQK